MGAVAATLAPTRTESRWIVGRGADAAFVIGSSAAGYLYLILYAALHVPVSWLWWTWSLAFDGTHIFGTASRTYFDSQARRRDTRLLFGSLAFFFLLGPAMVLAGWKGWLALMVGVWAYYHVARQHYGFLMLYRIKHREDPRTQALDHRFLMAMLIAPPLHRFFIHHPEELGLPKRLALASIAPWAEAVLWLVLAWLAVRYAVQLHTQAAAGHALNRPKLLLLASVIPLHWLTFAFMSWQAAVPTVTIVHNLQYHALIWFHNRNRYGGASSFGRIPAAVSRSLLVYAGLAVAFSLLYRLPGFHLGRVSDLAFGLFCGFGLTHYYLDSKIWRVRSDPELRAVLRLS
jgi:hypothetical protein